MIPERTSRPSEFVPTGTKTENTTCPGGIFWSPTAPASFSAPAATRSVSVVGWPPITMRFEALAKP